MFGYTVAPGDADDNGIWIGDQDRTLVGDRRLTTQAGAITSTATGTAADLTHAELGRQDNHKVDGTRSIVSVAVTSTPQLETDTYGAGETIEFTVTFNVAVDVTGDPVLEFLLDGSEVRQASDVSGSGTTTLVFQLHGGVGRRRRQRPLHSGRVRLQQPGRPGAARFER